MDSARAAGGGIAPGTLNPDNGFENLGFDIVMPLTFMQLSYTSKDKVVSGVLRYRLGSQWGAATGIGPNSLYGRNTINLYYAYINYRFSDQFSMRFGRQNTLLAPMSPSTYSGWQTWGHIVGIGWGNQNHTSLCDGITFNWKITPMVSLQAGIFEPDTDNGEAILATAGPAGTAREENILPRIDVALPINWNWLRIVPSFSYLQQEYDQGALNTPNDVDIWAGALSARASFGPFSITGEVIVGENLGVGSYNTAVAYATWTTFGLGTGIGGPKLYTPVGSATTQLADEDNVAFFFDLALKFGPATLHGIYGQSKSSCDGDPAIGVPGDGAEFDQTSRMYGLTCPISVGGGFTIRPEIMFYDYDDSAVRGGTPNLDMGEELIMSVIFMLAF
jgi:hypothetical protein